MYTKIAEIENLSIWCCKVCFKSNMKNRHDGALSYGITGFPQTLENLENGWKKKSMNGKIMEFGN